MTDISRTILNDYQVRKTRKQKDAFIQLLQTRFPELEIHEAKSFKSKNIIVGDIRSAKVVLTAHYDTSAVLPVPNFIAPKNLLLSVLYSLVLILPILIVMYLFNVLLNFVTTDFWTHYWISIAGYLGFLALIMFGPANKHTANDNTSGVITLCELLCSMSEEERQKTACVFFDNEEIGLVGSSQFRKAYRKQLQNKLLINFDCVSDGDHVLLAVSKQARKRYADAIAECFTDTNAKQFLIEPAEKVYYPSDQAGFKTSIAVAALKRKPVIGYYLDRIHTAKDTAFDEDNIALLVHSVHRFLQKI